MTESILIVIGMIVLSFGHYIENRFIVNWKRWYYKYGIVFFSKEFKLNFKDKNKFKKKISFRLLHAFNEANVIAVGENEIFFNSGVYEILKSRSLSISPLFRMNVKLENKSGCFRVTCLLNYYSSFFFIFFSFISLLVNVIFTIVLIVFMLGLIVNTIIKIKSVFIIQSLD